MKILVVCQHYWPEPYRLADLCEELVQRGHSVHVVTDVPNYPDGYIYEAYSHGKNRRQCINGVEISRTFTIGRRKNSVFRVLNYISFCLSSTAYIRKLPADYDAVLAYQTSPVTMSNAAVSYAKKNNKKVLLYCMDLWPASLCVGGVRESSLIYRAFWRISKSIYSKVDRLLVSSPRFEEYLHDQFGIARERMAYLPQYADVVCPIEAPAPKDTLDLVFAGNVGTAQSISTILKAANILKGNKSIRWHIAGNGSALESSKALARELGLQETVVFHGYLSGESLHNLYRLADAMLLTLTSDPIISMTLPMKLMSYMASGKGIIAAVDGAVADVIKEAGCGYAVAAESPELLAEAVRRFQTDEERSSYGQRAYEYYQANFDRELFMGRIERELDSLCVKKS